jgi:hypothetical protein
VWLGVRPGLRQPAVKTIAMQPVQQPTRSIARRETAVAPSVPAHPVAAARSPSRRPSSEMRLQAAKVNTARPALKQFPTPAPLTREEYALLALARAHPDALLAPPDETGKVSITPIDIKPLAPEGGAPQGEPE